LLIDLTNFTTLHSRTSHLINPINNVNSSKCEHETETFLESATCCRLTCCSISVKSERW